MRWPPHIAPPPRRLPRSLLCLVFGLCLSACSQAPASDDVVRIHAASSLTEAFQRLEALFEATHPGSDAVVSFAGSQILRLQIAQGAPADIFVSANRAHVDALIDAGFATSPRHVASNALAILVPSGNPSGIHGLHELPQARRIVMGTPQSPVGSYARALLSRIDSEHDVDLSARVMAHVVSEESNARLLRAKIALNEADAAIVYATDALNTEGVVGISLPPSENLRVDYYAASVLPAQRSGAVTRWRTFMTSSDARAVLTEMGYGAP